MKVNGTSENYQNQNLKAMIVFPNFLGSVTNFFDIKTKQQVLAFLDTRIKNQRSIPTEGGSLLGMIESGESSIFYGGYTIIKTKNRKE